MFRQIQYHVFAIVFALVLAVIPLAAQEAPPKTGSRPDTPSYGVRGPYTVGAMDFVMAPNTDRPLTLTVWYPALNSDGAEELIDYDSGIAAVIPDIPLPMRTFPGKAIGNALLDPSGGPYPLVVFSQGAGASRFFTAYLLEHLASYGFVVIAPEHTGSAYVDYFMMPQGNEAEFLADPYAYRIRDIVNTLDFAETLTAEIGSLPNAIDMEHVAVAGYSMGGGTALMVAGGRLDFDSLESWCAGSSQVESPGYDNSCALLAHKDQFAEILGIGDVQAGLWPSTRDPRVDAVLVMNPGRVPTMGIDGLANITVPALIMVSTNDQVDAAPANALFAYEHAGSEQKVLVEFEHANHFVFGACPEFWTANGFPFCFDSVWDVSRVHDLADHFSVAFLLAELKDDEDARAALALEAVAFPGVTYEAVGF